MSDDMTTTVGYDDVYQALREGEVRPLDDIHNIESAMSIVRNAREQIADLKELKKKRVEVITHRIAELEKQVEFLNDVILRTLQSADQKTVRFPGVGKVSRRSKKGTWVVTNTDQLLDLLKEEGEYENVVEMKPSLVKTELNKLLNVWDSVDKRPGCVTKDPDTENLSYSFDKETKDDVTADDVPVPKKTVVESGGLVI